METVFVIPVIVFAIYAYGLWYVVFRPPPKERLPHAVFVTKRIEFLEREMGIGEYSEEADRTEPNTFGPPIRLVQLRED